MKNKINFNDLDFDSMTLVAKEDPEEFERIRQMAIDEFIRSAPVERQQRLRCLQWRIDQERRNRTPLSACIRISRMMWDHLLGPGGLLGQYDRLLFDEAEVETQPAKIIDFPPRKSWR